METADGKETAGHDGAKQVNCLDKAFGRSGFDPDRM
jgi:hypothetical protein